MVLWCWWIAAVWAAPVTLPAGEDPATWQGALDHAGLEALEGSVEIGPVGAGQWRVQVRTLEGNTREATVAVATDEGSREEVALLAASLLRAARAPVGVGLPELPTLRPGEAVPVPVPVPVLVPVPVPVPELPEISRLEVLPEPAAPRFVSPGTPPVVGVAVPVTPTVSPWARVGVGMALRTRVRTGAAAAVWAGAEGQWWRLGGGLELGAPVLLPVDDDSRMQATDVAVGVWTTPSRLELGSVGALSRRGFTEAEDRGSWRGVGWLGAEVAVVLPVGLSTVRLSGRLARDLSRTELVVDDVVLRVLDPWHGGLWISVGTGRSGG